MFGGFEGLFLVIGRKDGMWWSVWKDGIYLCADEGGVDISMGCYFEL